MWYLRFGVKQSCKVSCVAILGPVSSTLLEKMMDWKFGLAVNRWIYGTGDDIFVYGEHQVHLSQKLLNPTPAPATAPPPTQMFGAEDHTRFATESAKAVTGAHMM